MCLHCIVIITVCIVCGILAEFMALHAIFWQSTHTHVFLALNVYVLMYASLQNGLNAVHLAAGGGHLSLVRELVDTHHANVYQTAEVHQPCACCVLKLQLCVHWGWGWSGGGGGG